MQFTAGGTDNQQLREEIRRVGNEIVFEVERTLANYGLTPSNVPLLHIDQVLVGRDNNVLTFIFNTRPGFNTMAVEQILSMSGTEQFDPEALINYAVKRFYFRSPDYFKISTAVLNLPRDVRAPYISDVVIKYLSGLARRGNMPKAPDGYRQLQSLLDAFGEDHPDYDRNVFLIMRFRDAPHFNAIRYAVISNLARHGLNCIRADRKTYPSDGDIWNNVCIHMLGCKYAVAVYEDIDEREFAVNISLEYGFMRALDKKVLLMKEQRMPAMPVDIIGKLYRPFDHLNIDSSVATVIDDWVAKDLHLK